MRILLVEDEQQIANFLKMSLEAEYFTVDVTEDGEKGSFLARTSDYDLLVLDNVLPGKSGLEITREVRAAGRTMPIIILSVKNEPATKVNFLNAGADDYLSKPFSLQELIARIRALLRRAEHIETATLTVDDLVLDTAKHRVRRGEREVALKPKEYALLEYLMRNKEVVLTRGMILEHVWDMTVDPFSNTIESHIRMLRKKIEASGERKIIHTIMKVGYMIGVDTP